MDNKVIRYLLKAFDKIKGFFTFIIEEGIRFPIYILFHPFKGFDEFKREKRAKPSIAIGFIMLFILLQILSFQYEGFMVNQNDISDLNTFAQITYVLVPILVIAFGNWSITTLFDGKGSIKEILMLIGYSLFPMIITQFIALFLSNMIAVEEIGLYSLVLSVGIFATGYMIFVGLVSIHEFGVLKCIITLIATLVAALVILFVALLGFDLFQKIYGFIYTIYREIALRYF
ncbi:MAG TPA: YIP1 family protein [Acholeplasmataceae bacterium]|nr:YIP1 family protein [Acholeplasmataceae bacterium]